MISVPRSILLLACLLGSSPARTEATSAFVASSRRHHDATSNTARARIGNNRIIPISTTAPTTSSLASSTGIDPNGAGRVVTNPSTRFGKPLTEDIQEFNKNMVGFLKMAIFDTIYAGRDYARFYALETIARVPYFSYLAALHFYETIGMWRKANYLKIHFAESWNELHHLLIMEELGGADLWIDRFVAQHISVGYYLMVLALYFWNPTMAYNLNEAIEEHAFATYDQFLKDRGEELKKLPAPQIAKDYYMDGDLYMFDEIQIDTCNPRRPEIKNLYDVFAAIRDDEAEHVKTMAHLQTDAELTNAHDEGCDVPADYLQGF